MLLPASIRRAFQMMKTRVFAVFADTPFLFFAVVIGVALAFRLGVGVVREAKAIPVVVEAVASGPEPALAVRDGAAPRSSASAGAPAIAASVEVGAAARVQPFGSPPPARLGPRPRGHGRKPPR